MLGLLLAALLSAAQPQPPHADPMPPSPPQPIVIGETWVLQSQALGAERVINVWTPPSYGQGDKRYPVVYLIDGGLAQDFYHITGLAQLGAISWQTQEMIVVGVETVDRRRELAFPVQRDAALRTQYPTAGESAAFRRHLVEEVKPFVEARYRVSGEDALLGESLAGLFVVETLLREPAAFDTYIAMDPSMWWDAGRLAEEASGLLARLPAGPRRLWLSVGSETLALPGFADRLPAPPQAAPADRLAVRYEPRPNLTHATIYHPTTWEALTAFYPRPDE